MKQRCPKGHKIRYATFRDAQLALIDIILYVNIFGDDPRRRSHQKKAAKRRECRIYPPPDRGTCPACGGYHLTSQPFRPAQP